MIENIRKKNKHISIKEQYLKKKKNKQIKNYFFNKIPLFQLNLTCNGYFFR